MNKDTKENNQTNCCWFYKFCKLNKVPLPFCPCIIIVITVLLIGFVVVAKSYWAKPKELGVFYQSPVSDQWSNQTFPESTSPLLLCKQPSALVISEKDNGKTLTLGTNQVIQITTTKENNKRYRLNFSQQPPNILKPCPNQQTTVETKQNYLTPNKEAKVSVKTEICHLESWWRRCRVVKTWQVNLNVIKKDEDGISPLPSPTPFYPPVSSPPSLTSRRVPIVITAKNYQDFRGRLLNYGPFHIYGWATNPAINNYNNEIATLAAINDQGVEKSLVFSSYKTLQEKLAQPEHADYLKSIGVTMLAFNSEAGMTPADEMTNLGSENPETNSVVQFIRIAKSYDFKVMWAPIRITLDNVSQKTMELMLTTGLDQIGLQEQKFIAGQQGTFSGCVKDRAEAVVKTIDRFQQVTSNQPIQAFVQLIPSLCLEGDRYAQTNCPSENISGDYQHCLQFINSITNLINGIGFWALSPEDASALVDIVSLLRQR